MNTKHFRTERGIIRGKEWNNTLLKNLATKCKVTDCVFKCVAVKLAINILLLWFTNGPVAPVIYVDN